MIQCPVTRRLSGSEGMPKEAIECYQHLEKPRCRYLTSGYIKAYTYAAIDICTSNPIYLSIPCEIASRNLPPTMCYRITNLSAVIMTIAFLSSGAIARNCQNSPGVANEECVSFYTSSLNDATKLGFYKPDCSGACYTYDSFGGLGTSGNGTHDTLSTVCFERS